MDTRRKPMLITIEGNIACGKSILLKQLKDFHNLTILSEPIEKWQNWEGYNQELPTKLNMLQLMYDNPKKYMKDFQIMGQITLADNHNYLTESPIKIIERSIYSGRYIFTKMAYQDDNLTYDEYKEICDYFKNIKKTVTVPDLIVYLRTDPKICYKRMKKRNREEEKNVSLEYLKKLHYYHEKLLINNQQLLPCPVIVLNSNKSIKEVKDKFINIINLRCVKKCSKCKQFKLKSDFYKNKKTKDGLQSYCIDCNKEYLKNYMNEKYKDPKFYDIQKNEK